MHLPRYLAVMQADTVATASSIDSELVSEVAALGFDREFITESIRHRVQVPRCSPPAAAYPAALVLGRIGLWDLTTICSACCSGSLQNSCFCPAAQGAISHGCAQQKMGHGPVFVVQNKASVAYYLMFDNQMRMKSGAYLREELSEASDAMMQHPSGAAAQALIEGGPERRAAMTAALAACGHQTRTVFIFCQAVQHLARFVGSSQVHNDAAGLLTASV